jgi:hypothetical protein
MKRSYGPRERDIFAKFAEAISALGGEATVREVCNWLDVNYPRKDGRNWKGDMVILGDFSNYPNGRPVTNTRSRRRIFLKTTSPGVEPARFKLQS